jgi:hypothetical protein
MTAGVQSPLLAQAQPSNATLLLFAGLEQCRARRILAEDHGVFS